MAMCGYRTGVIWDTTRPNWLNSGERPIAWSAWYPTDNIENVERPLGHFFDLGGVIQNADLTPKKTFPVVLLSHGTGGTAESMGWLASSLASEGYVVIGANHHGNTSLEPYFAEGFLCWWERASDLSVLLTSMAGNGFFASHLDLNRISAVGFSIGGYTVMALSGAVTSLKEFTAWRTTNNITTGGPKEFPDAEKHIASLQRTSEVFRQSWARHGDDFADDRITCAVVIAPPPPVRSFTEKSVHLIGIPTTILTGGADTDAPSEHCADWLLTQNNSFQHYDLGQDVGHYTFLGHPSDKTLLGNVDIFCDHENINRVQVHKHTAKVVLETLN